MKTVSNLLDDLRPQSLIYLFSKAQHVDVDGYSAYANLVAPRGEGANSLVSVDGIKILFSNDEYYMSWHFSNLIEKSSFVKVRNHLLSSLVFALSLTVANVKYFQREPKGG